MRENSVCAKISCIQVIILFLEIKFEFSLHENSVHMSKYTIFRNWVQATQLDFKLSSNWEKSTQSQLELRIELSWLSSTQLNSNFTTDLVIDDEFDFRKSFSSVILHVVDEDLKIMLHDSIDFLDLIIDFRVIHRW